MSAEVGLKKRPPRKVAPIFAALGDETRLALLAKLGEGEPRSITELAEGRTVTRQAITKHLRTLEGAGLVHSVREGRQTFFQLDSEPIDEVRAYLDRVSTQWDQALWRLKTFVED
jgi:DNA-binding transcriptional ArsR family regulator